MCNNVACVNVAIMCMNCWQIALSFWNNYIKNKTLIRRSLRVGFSSVWCFCLSFLAWNKKLSDSWITKLIPNNYTGYQIPCCQLLVTFPLMTWLSPWHFVRLSDWKTMVRERVITIKVWLLKRTQYFLTLRITNVSIRMVVGLFLMVDHLMYGFSWKVTKMGP